MTSFFIYFHTKLISYFHIGKKIWGIGGLVILAFVPSVAQTGIPYYSNFSLPEGVSNLNTAIIQEKNGKMLFTNNHGLLCFDGTSWEYVLQEKVPVAMGTDPETGQIYMATKSGFGILNEEPAGHWVYTPLYATNLIRGEVTSISFQNNQVIFYSQEKLFLFNPETGSVDEIDPGSDTFAGYLIFDNKIYLNIKGKGLAVRQNNRLNLLTEGDLFDNVSILFFISLSQARCLFVTDNSMIYFFNGKEFTDFIPEDDEYLSNAVISSGLRVSDHQICLATLSGGCVFIDLSTGKTDFTLNYQSGLPDDEIYATYIDQDHGIWLTHEYGATRIDMELPVRTFNPLKGLEGNLAATIWFKNKLYVSTSEGVFYLNRVKKYKETEIWVSQPTRVSSIINVPPAKKTQPLTVAEPSLKLAPVTEKSPEKRGFLSRIFKSEKPKQITRPATQSEKTGVMPKYSTEGPVKGSNLPDIQTEQEKQPTSYRMKKQVNLVSESWEFSKVRNLNAKCSQMLIFRDRLFVASNTGLYEIDSRKSKGIMRFTYVNRIARSIIKQNRLYAGTEEGLETIDFSNENYEVNHNYLPIGNPIYSILEERGDLWIGSDSKIYRVPLDKEGHAGKPILYQLPSQYSEPVIIRRINNRLTCFTPTGIFILNDSNEWDLWDSLKPGNDMLNQYLFTGKEDVFIKLDQGWQKLNIDNNAQVISPYLNLFENIRFMQPDKEDNLWVIDGNNQIFKILRKNSKVPEGHFLVTVASIAGARRVFQNTGSLFIHPVDQPVSLKLRAPWYVRPDRTKYQYKIDGLNTNWTDWTSSKQQGLPYLEKGDFTINIRARNVLGGLSNIQTVSLRVLPPFNRSFFFYFLIGLGVISLAFLIVVVRERKLLHDKKVLESKIQERTYEIEKQKERIEKQKNKIENQRDEITLRTKEITDSIDYGKKIQTAVLPPKQMLDSLLSDYFVFFRPRDVVSGDFYWVFEKNDKVAIAVADCSGHGVPGAFMSFLGYSILTEIGNNLKLNQAGKVLDQLRIKLKVALHQTPENRESEDGIDMALCIIDFKNRQCQFAGAYNPLYLVRDGSLREIHGNRMPIGIHLMDHVAFSNHKIELKKGDRLYMFTDGFADQFGGPKGKKFKIKPFNDLILKISSLSMAEQEKMLDEKMKEWMGKNEQVDDILVMGIRIH